MRRGLQYVAPRRLADVFDPRRNSLNALRLVLASAVIFRHAVVVVEGTTESPLWLDQIFGQLPVDGFFALSGFLIARSWAARPHVVQFLAARAGRLYPGFWACLVVTALCIRPLAALASGQELGLTTALADAARYVTVNASLIMFENDIAGSPSGVPWVGDWNASLWTLKWEFACYLGVMILGCLGLLVRRRFLSVVLLASYVAAALVAATDLQDIASLDALTRFVLMYLCGVWLAGHATTVRLSAVAVAGSLVLALGAAAVIPEYRLLGAAPLAYGLVGSGALFYNRRLRFENDISYGMYIYGFPVEQMLASMASVRALGPWWLAIVALAVTVPLAVASWVLVERPASKAVRRRFHSSSVPRSRQSI